MNSQQFKLITLSFRIFLVLLISYIVLFNLLGCNNKHKKDDNGLFGRVKSIKEIRYEVKVSFDSITKGNISSNWYDNFMEIYDKDGNLVERYWYNSDGSLYGKVYFLYNDYGNMDEIKSYDSDGSLNSVTKNKFDEQGKEIESVRYDPEGNMTSKNTYNYDDKGNRKESFSYNSDGEFDGKSVYNHDENGNMREFTKLNSDGTLWFKMTYLLDTNGNTILSKSYDSEEKLTSEETLDYKFDSSGNWINCIESINGIPQSIIERTIVYY